MTDPVYFTDDYPRTGCYLAVDVLATGYTLSVFEPSRKLIETYGAKTARQLAVMIEEWASGIKPRGNAPLDQASSGTSNT